MRKLILLFACCLAALVGTSAGAAAAPRTIASNPSLASSSYFGGSGYEMALGAAVDSAGNMYINGRTESANLTTTANAVSRTYGGGASDAFVAKFDPSGNLVYATYLGGSGEDEGRGIAVDAAGNVYVDGLTSSTDFPSANAFDPSFNGGIDAYVAKISPAGALAWSTYLGGGGEDKALALALDGSGSAYVTGEAGAGFPATAGPSIRARTATSTATPPSSPRLECSATRRSSAAPGSTTGWRSRSTAPATHSS